MNPIDDMTIGRDNVDRQLDLLVDGELTESQRSSLLLQLDQEPCGWRRCAMAFLESQCWKQELGVMARPAVQSPVQVEPVRRRSWGFRHLGTLMAVAASFLMAFALGVELRDTWSPRGFVAQPAFGPVATTSDAATTGTGVRQPPGLAPSPRPAVPSDQWELVTLTTPKGPAGAAETVRFPAVRRNDIDPQWLESLPGAVPTDVLQAFERTGHAVQQRRELVPLEMKDGRRLVVPVDQVEVHYVGRPSL